MEQSDDDDDEDDACMLVELVIFPFESHMHSTCATSRA